MKLVAKIATFVISYTVESYIYNFPSGKIKKKFVDPRKRFKRRKHPNKNMCILIDFV